MDRLTFDGNFCDIAQCRELPCRYGNNCMQKQVWERLRDYEDAGLAPKAAAQARHIEDCLNADGYSVARMVEVMNADMEGRVVVLPVKVDGEVFCPMPDGSVMAHQVMDYTVTEGCVPIAYCAGDTLADGTTYCGRFLPDEFGRSVFLTREEAEKALEARKDGATEGETK